MSQPLPMQPGIGFPPDSQVSLLRKLVWNTWLLAGGGGGGGIPAWVPVPASSASPGVAGQMAQDDSYLYIYTSGGWRRTPISDWA